jgi:hypothetical protein
MWKWNLKDKSSVCRSTDMEHNCSGRGKSGFAGTIGTMGRLVSGEDRGQFHDRSLLITLGSHWWVLSRLYDQTWAFHWRSVGLRDQKRKWNRAELPSAMCGLQEICIPTVLICFVLPNAQAWFLVIIKLSESTLFDTGFLYNVTGIAFGSFIWIKEWSACKQYQGFTTIPRDKFLA